MLEIQAPAMPGSITDQVGIAVSPEAISIAAKSEAPAMIGVAMRNEKSSASLLEIPRDRPAAIVIADREMPGMSASA